MNIVMIIPTGIGCEIGGHAGDGQAAARLIGGCCDNLITHPNVVNASDMNEMPENTWYVEGSILDRFLEGNIALEKTYMNKVLVVVNKSDYQSINAVSAARVSLGMDAEIVELNTPLELIATMKNWHGKIIASGEVNGWKELVEQVKQYDYDALAIATSITISEETLIKYFTEGGINPIGGVEAVASKLIANKINKPVAHGPIDYSMREFREVVDPRKAVEVITENYIHCILKGLHKAPRIIMFDGDGIPTFQTNRQITVSDVDLMISPMGCFGRPHQACLDHDIPIMVVRENTSVLDDFEDNDDRFIFVDNYIEAAGMIMAMRSGVHPPTVRRPLDDTKIWKKEDKKEKIKLKDINSD